MDTTMCPIMLTCFARATAKRQVKMKNFMVPWGCENVHRKSRINFIFSKWHVLTFLSPLLSLHQIIEKGQWRGIKADAFKKHMNVNITVHFERVIMLFSFSSTWLEAILAEMWAVHSDIVSVWDYSHWQTLCEERLSDTQTQQAPLVSDTRWGEMQPGSLLSSSRWNNRVGPQVCY